MINRPGALLASVLLAGATLSAAPAGAVTIKPPAVQSASSLADAPVIRTGSLNITIGGHGVKIGTGGVHWKHPVPRYSGNPRELYGRAGPANPGWHASHHRKYHHPGWHVSVPGKVAIGIAVGKAIVHAPKVVVSGLPATHIAWCQGRYKSYQAWNNTFNPGHGGRKQCRSPYWR